MHLLADILMNQELVLSGTLDMHGIQQPIVPGDNVEYDGVIAHIETVSHRFSVAPTGSCVFTTQIEVSHGVSAAQLQGNDEALFSGISPGDISTFDPAVTQDGPNTTVGTGSETDSIIDVNVDVGTTHE
jgi:hypothetical protein